MEKSERAGLGICAAVLAIYLVQLACLMVRWYQIPPRDFSVMAQLLSAMVAVGGIAFAFRKGDPAARRACCAGLVFLGVLLIASGYGMTTLEFPNAVSAEERARMQESCRREWPWWAAWGSLNILAGTLLLLPPVGRFLQARREALAPKVAERQKGTA
jgi:hypothetical protein